MATKFAMSEGLLETIATTLRDSRYRSAVIHAGHYSLADEGDGAADGLDDDSPSMPFSSFARLTWRVACRLVADARSTGVDVKLLVLVNDWQFLHVRDGDRRASESRAATLRRTYYRDTARLPRYHATTLEEFALDPNVVMPSRDERWLFSETELRSDLAATVRGIFARGEAEKHSLSREFNSDGEPIITVQTVDACDYTLLYCGSTNCAGEIVELLRILRQRGVDLFVNLLPRQCFAPVETGTLLAHRIYGLAGMKIMNVSIPFVEDLARGAEGLGETSSF